MARLLRYRRRPRLRSVSIKVGPFTWNPTRRNVRTDLPGGFYTDHPTPRRDQR